MMRLVGKIQDRFFSVEQANEMAGVLNEDDEFRYEVVEKANGRAQIAVYNEDGEFVEFF